MDVRRAVPFLVALTVLAAPACRRGAAPAPATVPAGPTWSAVSAQRLYYDNAGGIQDSLRVVIRDAEQLRSVWSRATSLQAAPPPVPEVNFEREMLLVVAAGRRDAEDQIRIDSVGLQREPAARGRAASEEMTAVVRLTEGCRRFATDAYPVEIVRVQRFNGPVTWVERRVPASECARSQTGVPAGRMPAPRVADAAEDVADGVGRIANRRRTNQ
jgi:hypothetical protein